MNSNFSGIGAVQPENNIVKTKQLRTENPCLARLMTSHWRCSLFSILTANVNITQIWFINFTLTLKRFSFHSWKSSSICFLMWGGSSSAVNLVTNARVDKMCQYTHVLHKEVITQTCNWNPVLWRYQWEQIFFLQWWHNLCTWR